METVLQVGIITNTHGIQGEVKVLPTTDDAARFKKLTKVTLDTGKEKKELTICQVKFFKQFVILKFQEFQSIEEVQGLKGKSLWIPREQAVPLKKNEYFIADLIGIQVESDEGDDLGVIQDVLQTGANDVYLIGKDQGKQYMIPAIKECILNVDIDQGKMKVHFLDGLKEL